jgi:hypothetical protein
MTRAVRKRILWASAIAVAYGGLVALAYAIGPAPAECSVVGHGRITTARGDQASFRGLAATPPPRGGERYVDTGPAEALHLTSLSVEKMTCDADASRASIAGRGTVSGSGSVRYLIELRLGPPGAPGEDSFRLTLSNGYDSGAQPMRHASVDIHFGAATRGHHDADAEQTLGAPQDGG